MKRTGGLYERIMEPENIRRAFLKAAKSKRNRNEVKIFAADFEKNIRNIYQQFATGKFNIGNYRFFTVYDPKMRNICAAEFPERVLHHAVMNICEPVLENNAVYDSYACRKGKGAHKALKRAQYFSIKHPWYLKMDIRKYFDSIDHAVLMTLLNKRIKDHRLFCMVERILSTYETEPGKGLPIGNLVSQHMANFYLNPFDHRIKKEQGRKGYLRYMDDFIVFGENSKELKGKHEIIVSFLKDKLDLEPKPNSLLNKCKKGIPFLGFKVYPERIRLSNNGKKRFTGKFRSYEKKMITGEMSEKETAVRVSALIEFTKTADAKAFRLSVIQRYGASS